MRRFLTEGAPACLQLTYGSIPVAFICSLFKCPKICCRADRTTQGQTTLYVPWDGSAATKVSPISRPVLAPVRTHPRPLDLCPLIPYILCEPAPPRILASRLRSSSLAAAIAGLTPPARAGFTPSTPSCITRVQPAPGTALKPHPHAADRSPVRPFSHPLPSPARLPASAPRLLLRPAAHSPASSATIEL